MVLWGHFGVTLGTVWLLGIILGIIAGSLWGYLAYMKVRFQKTFIFPTDLNGFIQRRGELWANLRETLGFVWHMRVTLDPCWCHFGQIIDEWQV